MARWSPSKRSMTRSCRESFADGGWDRALYGDSSGWVVRVTRTRRITKDALMEVIAEAKQLAAHHGGQVRGLTVEDLRREDRWGELAAQLRDRTLRQADTDDEAPRLLPAQRETAVGEGVPTRPLSP